MSKRSVAVLVAWLMLGFSPASKRGLAVVAIGDCCAETRLVRPSPPFYMWEMWRVDMSDCPVGKTLLTSPNALVIVCSFVNVP